VIGVTTDFATSATGRIEMIPQIAPMIAEALSKARLVTISGDSAEGTDARRRLPRRLRHRRPKPD
jgi:hypothetical protein